MKRNLIWSCGRAVIYLFTGTLQVWCIALDQWNAKKSSDAFEEPWRTDPSSGKQVLAAFLSVWIGRVLLIAPARSAILC